MDNLEKYTASGKIELGSDGVYRWDYELPMMKNPVLLISVWKVLAISVSAPALLVFFADLSDGFADALITGIKVYGLVLGIITVVLLIAYTILAAIYGWKYLVSFEMNDEGFVHTQQPKQFKKAQALGHVTAAAGVAGKNPATAGSGLLLASKSSSTTVFKNVRKIIGRRGLNTIKVNQLFSKNQIYVDPADYDFVWDYIVKHCTNAKIIK